MKVSWGARSAVIHSEQELVVLLAMVRAASKPVILFVEHSSGATLAAGIGAPESVLTYVGSNGTSFHSVGDTRRLGRLQFLCRDQVDEFMEEMAVPEADAIAALLQFVEAGARPNNIQWEADW